MTTEIWIAVAAGVALLAVWLVWRRWLRPRADTRAALQAVAVTSLRDVLVPDGMGGQIYIDHLLLTSRGVAVIDVKDFAGTVFAGDRMQEWTVIGAGRRFGFPNPQGTLLDRVAAVRQLVPNVPVEGHILFGDAADFSKGRPKHVLVAGELQQHFGNPGKSDRERLTEAYAPHWSRLKEASVRVDKS